MTTIAIVAAMRCSQVAAFSDAGVDVLRIPSSASTPGTGMPVTHDPGISMTERMRCTVGASRNVLCQVTRYSRARPRR